MTSQICAIIFLSFDTKIEKQKAFTVQHETELLLRFQNHTNFIHGQIPEMVIHTCLQWKLLVIGREMTSYRSQVLPTGFRQTVTSSLTTWLKTFWRLTGKLLQGIAPKTLSTSLSVENENSPSLFPSARFTLKVCSTRAPWITNFN